MLSPRWRKVARDLWGDKSRTALVVLSIAVGVFAVGTLASAQVVLERDLQEGYAASNPASATISTRSSGTSTGRFGDELVRSVRRMEGVRDAEARRSTTVRLQLANGQWRNLVLVAYPDYGDIRIGKIVPQTGAWPPGKREVLLERTGLSYLGVDIGDSLMIETSAERQLTLSVAGSVYDPSRLSPALQSSVFGYISVDTMEWLGQPRDFNDLRIVVEGDAGDRAHIIAVANAVSDKVEASGRSVASVSVPARPGKHPADDIMQSILLILGVLGALSLFLSGFLVVNTISAMVAQQIRQIGMMKAVGARAGQVLGLYLGMVLVYGALALCIAVPAAALGTIGLTSFAAGLVNLDITSPPVPLSVLALEAAVSLFVPALAALYPLAAGTRIRVHAALSDYGLGQAEFGAGAVDRAITLVSSRGWLSRPLMLSLRNTFRRKGRLMLTLATLSLGGAIFIAVFSVQASIRLTLEEALRFWNYDADVSFRRSYRVGRIAQAASTVEGVAAAESWGYSGARRLRADDSEGDAFQIVALPADTEMLRPTLLEGRWLLPEDDNALVINAEVRDLEPDLAVGSGVTVKIGDRESDWRVVGIVRGVLAGPAAYANYPHFAQVVHSVGRASRVQVQTDERDTAYQTRVAQELEAAFREAGIRVSLAQTTGQMRDRTTSQLDILIAFLLIMALLLAAVGALGLAGMMGINVLERRREIGVIRAIGASDGAVLRIFIAEGVLVGLLSWLAGTVLAVPIGVALSDAVGMAILKTPLSFAYSFQGAGLWLSLAVVIAALSSLVPARRAAQLTVHEVLAYE